jgi:hypothetical protein
MFRLEWWLIRDIFNGYWYPTKVFTFWGISFTLFFFSNYGPFESEEEAYNESNRIGKMNVDQVASFKRKKKWNS